MNSPASPDRDGSRDFDFQTGRWRIHNERLVKRLQGCTDWETFEAIVNARLLPGGLGNIDEYLTDHWPGFVGVSLRLYDRGTGKWSIYWASNRTGTLDPPVVGSFVRGRRLRGSPGAGWPADPRAVHVVERHEDLGPLGAGVLAR